MTNKQYQVLLDFYNEFPMEFKTLTGYLLEAFYARLYSKE